MATGSGKTFTAISFIYRLIKFAGARRVLFLVDRGNLGRQTKKEFDQYVSPVNNYKFGEEYIVQHLTSNQLDKTARVCICTIQRMYSMLKGRELPEERMRDPPRARGGACSRNRSPSTTTPRSRSRPSTSSSPTRRTAPSTTCGARCWNTSTPT